MINVIIPMFNSSKYICRCIESVMCQTYEDWNMIIVDDGSSDDSLLLASEYAENDSRINVFYQENKGAGAARNYAISKIEDGQYTVFIDSDDYIAEDYFELLSQHEEDVVFIDVLKCETDTNKKCIESLSKFAGLEKDKFIRAQMTGKILWGGVRKAVQTKLLRSYDIQFSNQQVGEEALYSFDVLYYSHTFGFITKPVYKYEVRKDSLSQVLIEDPWGPVAIELKKKLQKEGLYNQYSCTINAFLYSAAAISLVRIAKKYRGKEYRVMARNRIYQLYVDLDDKVQYDRRSLSLRVKVILYLIKMRCFFLIWCIGRIKMR